eukprot:2601039-Rhodomonas_salina.1
MLAERRRSLAERGCRTPPLGAGTHVVYAMPACCKCNRSEYATTRDNSFFVSHHGFCSEGCCAHLGCDCAQDRPRQLRACCRTDALSTTTTARIPSSHQALKWRNE